MLNNFGSVGNISINKHGPMVESGERNVSPCHFAYNESYMDSHEIEPGPLG
jgi:hypothetical protein